MLVCLEGLAAFSLCTQMACCWCFRARSWRLGVHCFVARQELTDTSALQVGGF